MVSAWFKKRFEEKVQVTPGCWLWKGIPRSSDGYGNFVYDGHRYLAHRASYKLYKGEIPEGLWILHRCHNPQCVNPEHIYAGTPYDNAQDRIKAKAGISCFF